MIDTQPYTSNLLSHFVGRSLTSDEEQYNLLLKIIKQDSTLYANINEPHKPTLETALNRIRLNQGELFDRCDCVCFCDIPFNSLSIHRKKYSSFGLGFKKPFLISKGARPVMYVPKNCVIEDILPTKTPKAPDAYFKTLENQAGGILSILMMLDQVKPIKEQFNEILDQGNSAFKQTVQQFIIDPIGEVYQEDPLRNILVYLYAAWITQCKYIKVYDDTLQEDDVDNYYMEREWRCTNNIDFSLLDINTIFLPDHTYQDRFIHDVPEYKGEFCIFNK